jgi:hypothetical protein
VKASEAMPSLDFDHFRSSCATDQTTGQKQQGILLSDQTKTEKADRKRKRQKKDTRAMTRSAPAAQKKEAQKKSAEKERRKKEAEKGSRKRTPTSEKALQKTEKGHPLYWTQKKEEAEKGHQAEQKKDTHFTGRRKSNSRKRTPTLLDASGAV